MNRFFNLTFGGAWYALRMEVAAVLLKIAAAVLPGKRKDHER